MSTVNNKIELQHSNSILRNTLIIIIPLAIIGIILLLAKSSLYNLYPQELSKGITVDLLLLLPLIYFLLIRKTKIPKITVVPFLILCTVLCTFILPAQNHTYLDLFKTWVIPVIELGVVVFVIVNVLRVIRNYKKKRETSSFDFFTVLKETCTEILPKPAVWPTVTEISIFYYGFIYWKKRKLRENEFSYHKESGSVALLAVTIFIIAIETMVLHSILLKLNAVVAWIVTGLSIYSGLQILGFLKSILKRPIYVDTKEKKLYLKYGIMSECTIDFDEIDSIEISSKDIDFDDTTAKLSILGAMESHNVVIKLKSIHTLHRLYGIKRRFNVLALSIDNKNEFRNILMDSILETN